MKPVAATPLRLGVVGAGNVVSNYHLPVLQGEPRVRLSWIVDPNLSRAREVAQIYGIPAAVPSLEGTSDVDAVLVASPLGTRRPILETLTSRGWHGFIEKPFAATRAEHEWMLGLASKHGCLLTVGFVKRHYESTKRARRLLDAQLLGPIREILTGDGARARKFGRGGDWYQGNAAAVGGTFFETGSHLVDTAFTVCGIESFRLERCDQRMAGALEMETRALATVTLKDGSRVPFRASVSRLTDVYNGLVVRCRHGEIRVPPDPEASVSLWSKSGALVDSFPGTPKPGILPAIMGEWGDFLDRCASGDDTDVDTGILTTAFMEQCYDPSRRALAASTASA